VRPAAASAAPARITQAALATALAWPSIARRVSMALSSPCLVEGYGGVRHPAKTRIGCRRRGTALRAA